MPTSSCLNSWVVNPEPLSETTCFGMPWVANRLGRTLIVASNEVEFTTCDSIYLEWASTTMRKVCPRNRSAWSMCRRVQGLLGYSQGCNGNGRSVWHFSQNQTLFTIADSKLGHYTKQRAKHFIQLTPGWTSWSWFRIISWPVGGITTRESHKTYSSKTLSPRRRLKYRMNIAIPCVTKEIDEIDENEK